jgi:hypothetical protein
LRRINSPSKMKHNYMMLSTIFSSSLIHKNFLSTSRSLVQIYRWHKFKLSMMVWSRVNTQKGTLSLLSNICAPLMMLLSATNRPCILWRENKSKRCYKLNCLTPSLTDIELKNMWQCWRSSTNFLSLRF